MRNFNIQGLTLTMMIVMVYAASLRLSHDTHNNKQEKHQLGLIRDQAEKMLSYGVWNQSVPKVSGRTDCTIQFFCLAEKSLKTLNKQEMEKKAHNDTEKLTRLLHQYNNMTKNGTDCKLDKDSTYHVETLLTEIKDCIRQVFNKPPNKK